MTPDGDQEPGRPKLTATTIDLAIRIGFVGLLGYWAFRVISPFLTIGLWSAILTVALYPAFSWLTQRLSPRLAAAVITLLCLLIIVGPLAWLGLGMIEGIRFLTTGLETGQLAIPLPPASIKTWPVIGERLHELWTLAANNVMGALAEVMPLLKPVGTTLLDIAQSVFISLLELLAAIAIAGFLFTRGPQLVETLSAFLGRVLSNRGKELVQLAGAVVHNVSRGVIGISVLQAVLAGAGFLAAGIPAAGVLAFVALLLGIVQIGPTLLFIPIIVWSWAVMETIPAVLFTAYMLPVGLVDNVLKPLVMGRRLSVPMPVIMVGVIGGTISYGFIGLFFGPIVLSVAWSVLVAWARSGEVTVPDDTPH